jgi:transmembrane sensor
MYKSIEPVDKELLGKILNKEATEEEKVRFLDFCDAHDLESSIIDILEKEYYSEYSEDFDGIGNLLSKIHLQILENDSKKNIRHSGRFLDINYYSKLAASIIIIISVSGFFIYDFLKNFSQPVPPKPIALISKIASYGQKLTFNLPDGSLVKLNSGSELTYPEEFSDSLRNVWLEGEAYFVVRADEKRPFEVHAGDTKTIVLGTIFNIFSRKGITKVALEEGKVQVEDKNQSVILEPGQMTVYEGDFKMKHFNPASELAWKEGRITLKRENFPAFAKKLEEWYGVSIVFQDKIAANRTLSGSFNNESLENIIYGICYSLDCNFKINKDERKVIITNKN